VEALSTTKTSRGGEGERERELVDFVLSDLRHWARRARVFQLTMIMERREGGGEGVRG
jgi:hypothetical protein